MPKPIEQRPYPELAEVYPDLPLDIIEADPEAYAALASMLLSFRGRLLSVIELKQEADSIKTKLTDQQNRSAIRESLIHRGQSIDTADLPPLELYRIGMLYYKAAEYEQATRYLEAYLERKREVEIVTTQDPLAPPSYELGVSYGKLKKYDAALKYLQIASKEKTSDEQIIKRAAEFGWQCLNDKNNDTARLFFKLIIERHVNVFDANFGMALVYFNNKHWEEALNYVESAIAKDTTRELAYYLKAVLHEKLGDPKNTKEALLLALQINPHHTEIQRKLAEIRIEAMSDSKKDTSDEDYIPGGTYGFTVSEKPYAPGANCIDWKLTADSMGHLPSKKDPPLTLIWKMTAPPNPPPDKTPSDDPNGWAEKNAPGLNWNLTLDPNDAVEIANATNHLATADRTKLN